MFAFLPLYSLSEEVPWMWSAIKISPKLFERNMHVSIYFSYRLWTPWKHLRRKIPSVHQLLPPISHSYTSCNKNIKWQRSMPRWPWEWIVITLLVGAYIFDELSLYRPFSHCIDQAGLGTFTAKSGRKHYNPPPLTVMWMNFDSPNFPSFCSLSAIISFQTCSNKCILYVLSFHKCIKIKYKMVNMYGVFRD